MDNDSGRRNSESNDGKDNQAKHRDRRLDVTATASLIMCTGNQENRDSESHDDTDRLPPTEDSDDSKDNSGLSLIICILRLSNQLII